ncbi:hypothetical protein FRX31_002407, partial [Thalictrum thalictroides]
MWKSSYLDSSVGQPSSKFLQRGEGKDASEHSKEDSFVKMEEIGRYRKIHQVSVLDICNCL